MFVICVNDENKPETVDPKNWIKKGEIYTIRQIAQKSPFSEQTLVLKEKRPDPPYFGFTGSRFLPFPFSQN